MPRVEAELTRRLQVCRPYPYSSSPRYQFICKCGHSVRQDTIRKGKPVRCSCQHALLGQTLLSKGQLTASPYDVSNESFDSSKYSLDSARVFMYGWAKLSFTQTLAPSQSDSNLLAFHKPPQSDTHFHTRTVTK
jgi:hypothetical protein